MFLHVNLTYLYAVPLYYAVSRERISGGDYSFPSDIWGVGMTVLALAMGRYPFLAGSPRTAGAAEIGEGGYWAILQAIQERPSVGSLLRSTSLHCQGHTHSFAAIYPPTHTKEHMFSHELHSFLSMALHRDHKQRPSAHTLQTYPFVSYSSPQLETIVQATAEFIEQCCVRTAVEVEARAESAIERSAKFSAKANSSRLGGIAEDDGEGCGLPTGARTADKAVYPRRRLPLAAGRDQRASSGGTRMAHEDGVTCASVDVLGEGNGGTSSTQQEGAKHLQQIVKAYRDYVKRTWTEAAEITGGDSSQTERVILNTVWPLLDEPTMSNLALHLHVPLRIVKKAFKDIVMDFRDKIEATMAVQGTVVAAQPWGSPGSDEEGAHVMGVWERNFARTDATGTFNKATPNCLGGDLDGVLKHGADGTDIAGESSVCMIGDIVSSAERMNIRRGVDPLELSGSAEMDAVAVAELRALVRSNSQLHTPGLDSYRSGGILTQRSAAVALETAREVCEEEEEEEDGGYSDDENTRDGVHGMTDATRIGGGRYSGNTDSRRYHGDLRLSSSHWEAGELGSEDGMCAVDSADSIVDEVAEAIAALGRGSDNNVEEVEEEVEDNRGSHGESRDKKGCNVPDVVRDSQPPLVAPGGQHSGECSLSAVNDKTCTVDSPLSSYVSELKDERMGSGESLRSGRVGSDDVYSEGEGSDDGGEQYDDDDFEDDDEEDDDG